MHTSSQILPRIRPGQYVYSEWILAEKVTPFRTLTKSLLRPLALKSSKTVFAAGVVVWGYMHVTIALINKIPLFGQSRMNGQQVTAML